MVVLRRHSRAGWQVVPVVAWILLLANSLAPQELRADPRLTLCLVTLLSAAGCWARACLPAQRVVWALMAFGLSGYAVGFLVLFTVSQGEGGGPWGLNYSDCASLLLYPAGYASLILLAHSRIRSWTPAALLDGGIVALAASSLAVGWVARTSPALLDGGPLDNVYAFAYPVGAATLLVVTVTGLAATQWQVDRVWALLALGFAVMAVGQGVYGFSAAAGNFRFGSPLDAVYTAGPVLICLAAWRRPENVPRRAAGGNVAVAVPAVATLAALIVLLADHERRVPTAAVALAGAAILLAVCRILLSWRQERQLAESRLEAQTDELTGMPNRRALLERVRVVIARNAPDTYVVLLDLDGFKEVNDTLGHAAGDRLLLEFSDRLRVVAGDRVARLGGDEFAFVLEAGTADPAVLVGQLRQAVSDVAVVDGCRISVRVSLGLAQVVPTGSGPAPAPAELLRRADVARHRAKALRTGVETWSSQLDDGARDRLALLAELRSALDAPDQIVVFYQPQVEPVSGAVLAMEALVRWQHPRRGLLAPGAFLDTLEQAGLMPELTRRVLDLVATEQARHQVSGSVVLPVSVNVGAGDLLDPHFANSTAARLARFALAPSCLRIEVTEGVVMTDPERILTTLHQLEALGIALSLDDYGTGLSSLAYLRLLPVDELKIDRSFISRMSTDPASALIVGSTIALAHGLGLRVVAEGVEDAETLTALSAAGCDLVQGYLLGRPAPGGPPVPALALPLATTLSA